MTEAQHTPAASLAQELESARELLDCLQQEQAHLIQADIAALEACAERKNGLVGRMNMLAAARLQSLAAGHPATEAGMLAWLAEQQDTVRADWRALLGLAASGKELNRTNGLLIHQHMNRNQSGLQALRSGGQQPGVYGRDGQQNVRTSGRTFVAG